MGNTAEPKQVLLANAALQEQGGAQEIEDEYLTALDPNGSHEWDALFEPDPSKQSAKQGLVQSTFGAVKNGAQKAAGFLADGAKATGQVMFALARDYAKEREAQARRAEYERKKAAEVAAYQRTQNGKKVSVSGYTRD